MPTPTATAEYMKLSVSERIQLVEEEGQVWYESKALGPGFEFVPLTSKYSQVPSLNSMKDDEISGLATPWE